jgi:hypothetical protein
MMANSIRACKIKAWSYFTGFCRAVLEFFKHSMGAGNRVGIGLSYLPARQATQLAELVHWNRFLGSGRVDLRL